MVEVVVGVGAAAEERMGPWVRIVGCEGCVSQGTDLDLIVVVGIVGVQPGLLRCLGLESARSAPKEGVRA